MHKRSILKLPAASCRESSKCKVFISFYCSSLANPVRLRRTTGNALALLNFPKGTLFNGASYSIFNNSRYV
jgi:hypothetical protein